MADLRSRQTALARQVIVDACAELMTERRHLDFAMKDVAERAGVSPRTVYNHFPTREDLLETVGNVFNEEMAARGGATTSDLEVRDDLLRAVRVQHRLFEELGGISDAFAQMPLADIGLDADRHARTQRLVDFLVQQMPDVPEREATAIAVVLRHLLSHRSWFWLCREYGLTTEQISDVVTWAIGTLIDTAEAGDLPHGTEQS